MELISEERVPEVYRPAPRPKSVPRGRTGTVAVLSHVEVPWRPPHLQVDVPRASSSKRASPQSPPGTSVVSKRPRLTVEPEAPARARSESEDKGDVKGGDEDGDEVEEDDGEEEEADEGEEEEGEGKEEEDDEEEEEEEDEDEDEDEQVTAGRVKGRGGGRSTSAGASGDDPVLAPFTLHQLGWLAVDDGDAIKEEEFPPALQEVRRLVGSTQRRLTVYSRVPLARRRREGAFRVVLSGCSSGRSRIFSAPPVGPASRRARSRGPSGRSDAGHRSVKRTGR